MTFVTVSKKGQIVIPSKIRHSLGITAGSTLAMSIEAGSIKIIVEAERKALTRCVGFHSHSLQISKCMKV